MTLLEEYQRMLASSRIENFRVASGLSDKPFCGIYFNDSDVYKWIEAAAYYLAAAPDPEIARDLEECIDAVVPAQKPDGFLNTFFTTEGRDAERWSNLRDKHQLYCAGHFLQCAVAHYRASGSTRMLDAARRLADCICAQFGLASEGKQEETDGHPEIELALVELYRATGEKRYLRQAEFFLDVRGRDPKPNEYWAIDHAPYREVNEITGHAVRALYLACGATDIALETGDATLLPVIHSQWRSFQSKKRFVTGGAGARWRGEEFGDDYELPQRCYCETCAAIASMMWSQRLFALDADPSVMDSLEWTFFNAVLPGISRSGKEFFYQNILIDNGQHRRTPWFECACCPPNIARLLASLPSYAFSVSDKTAWIHLPLTGETSLDFSDGQTAAFEITGDYPWGADVCIEVKSSFSGILAMRVPGWCAAPASISLNGRNLDEAGQPGGYCRIEREWQAGDRVHFSFECAPRLIEPHPFIFECHNLVAVARGPLLYCAEACDNPSVDLRNIELLAESEPRVISTESDWPTGAVSLSWPALNPRLDSVWDDRLYRTRVQKLAASPMDASCNITLIPYFCWGNRQPGRMQVWQKCS